MTALVAAPTDPRELALLKAVGLDRVSPEQRELALHIATRYDLDLMLKHIVMIEGRPYITRDALLHIAHRSGVLDGIETTDPVLVDGFWRASCSVYRKDMSRPFTYGGRYPETGSNRKFAPEMAIKVAESMALRRAFDISAPTQDERWDHPEATEVVPVPPTPTLAERVAAKAAEVAPEPTNVAIAATGASESVIDAAATGASETAAASLAARVGALSPVPSVADIRAVTDAIQTASDAIIDAAWSPAYVDDVDAPQPVPVAEGQEALPIEPDVDALTKDQFAEMCKAHRIAPEYATGVRKQMFPGVNWTDITDAQRAAIMREMLA